jgi:hypothetical protein
MLTPPANLAGAAQSRITVQAENDGQVLFDGQGARRPLQLTGGNHYWTLRGMNGCCAHDTTLMIGQGANHNRVERVIVWDTADPGSGVISIWGSTGTVLQDVAAWGHGRKMLGRVNDTDSTVLRGFFLKFAVSDTASGDDVTTTYAYKSKHSRMYHIIAAMDIPPGQPAQSVIVWGGDHYNDTSGTVTTHDLRGNIFYHVDGQHVAGASVGMRRSMNPGNVDPSNAITTVSRNNLTLRRGEAVPEKGHDCPQDGTRSICDDAQWTDSVGTLEGGTHTTDGGSIPAGAAPDLLGLKATAQPAHGAWIKHCYREDGTLDMGCQVWPWPMNQRIKEALVASDYAERGLDGQGETDLTALLLRLAGSVLPPGPRPLPPVQAPLACTGALGAHGRIDLVCRPQSRR